MFQTFPNPPTSTTPLLPASRRFPADRSGPPPDSSSCSRSPNRCTNTRSNCIAPAPPPPSRTPSPIPPGIPLYKEVLPLLLPPDTALGRTSPCPSPAPAATTPQYFPTDSSRPPARIPPSGTSILPAPSHAPQSSSCIASSDFRSPRIPVAAQSETPLRESYCSRRC